MSAERLTDNVALVTGGASGLGKAIAQRLVAEGARVVITDKQAKLGQQTAAQIGAYFIAHDVTDEEGWSEVIQQIWARYSCLNILVNNAGILGPRDAAGPEDTRLVDWRKIFSVNVESVFLGCRAAIPLIHRSGGGSIVNMSSVAGILATPYAMAYGASKAAVRQLTKSVAQHCVEKRMKINCNSVHPGNVRTPLWEKNAADTALARGVSVDTVLNEGEAAVPMGEFTNASDIAAGVVYLCSAEARHVTGMKLVIDGGIIYCDTYKPASEKAP